MRLASLPHRGMLSDTVLKLRGRSAEFAISPPTELGQDEEGYIVAWHYEDCDVVLHYRQKAYRVKEVIMSRKV